MSVKLPWAWVELLARFGVGGRVQQNLGGKVWAAENPTRRPPRARGRYIDYYAPHTLSVAVTRGLARMLVAIEPSVQAAVAEEQLMDGHGSEYCAEDAARWFAGFKQVQQLFQEAAAARDRVRFTATHAIRVSRRGR